MKRIFVSLLTCSMFKFVGEVNVSKSNFVEIKGDLMPRKFSPILFLILLITHIICIKSMLKCLFVDKSYVYSMKQFYTESIEEIDISYKLQDKITQRQKNFSIFLMKYSS